MERNLFVDQERDGVKIREHFPLNEKPAAWAKRIIKATLDGATICATHVLWCQLVNLHTDCSLLWTTQRKTTNHLNETRWLSVKSRDAKWKTKTKRYSFYDPRLFYGHFHFLFMLNITICVSGSNSRDVTEGIPAACQLIPLPLFTA